MELRFKGPHHSASSELHEALSASNVRQQKVLLVQKACFNMVAVYPQKEKQVSKESNWRL